MGNLKNSSMQKCPSCGGDLVKSSRVLPFVKGREPLQLFGLCVHCHKEYDSNTVEFYRVFADDFASKFSSQILATGLKGRLHGNELQISGKVLYYSDSGKAITKWLLKNVNGDVGYIFEYDNKFFLGSKVVDIAVEIDNGILTLAGRRYDKFSLSNLRTIFFEGCSDCKEEIGEEVAFYELKENKQQYIILKNKAEITVIEAIPLDIEEIVTAFELKDLQEVFSGFRNRIEGYKSKVFVYFLSMLVSFFVLLYSFYCDEYVKSLEVSREIITLNKHINDNVDGYYISQILYGPFELKYSGSLYEFKIVSKGFGEKDIFPNNIRFKVFLLEERKVSDNTEKDPRKSNLRNFFDEIELLQDPVESISFSASISDKILTLKDIVSLFIQQEDRFFVLSVDGKYYLYLEIYSKEELNLDYFAPELKRTQSRRYFFVIFLIFLILIIINNLLFFRERGKFKHFKGKLC